MRGAPFLECHITLEWTPRPFLSPMWRPLSIPHAPSLYLPFVSALGCLVGPSHKRCAPPNLFPHSSHGPHVPLTCLCGAFSPYLTPLSLNSHPFSCTWPFFWVSTCHVGPSHERCAPLGHPLISLVSPRPST
jgi:hypothetical protein